MVPSLQKVVGSILKILNLAAVLAGDAGADLDRAAVDHVDGDEQDHREADPGDPAEAVRPVDADERRPPTLLA